MSEETRKAAAARVRSAAHEVEQIEKRFMQEVLLPPSEHGRIKKAQDGLQTATRRLRKLADELDPPAEQAPQAESA